MRRRVLLAASVAVAFAASRGSAGDADEWERPFDGVLPEPQEGVSVNPPEDDVATPLPRAATCIVDGTTGKPVPGATLTLFPEDIEPDVTTYSRPIAAGIADAAGMAWLDASSCTEAGHWIAEARGYAPAYSYGRRPPPRMALARGMDISVRLFDPMGRPAEGAEADIRLGCSHSGALRRARPAKDGTFTLPSMPPDETQLWVASRAGCLGFAQGLGRLGRRPSDAVLVTAVTARGRLVDSEDEPVAGVVVRVVDFERAPVAVSGADGRFELVGGPLTGALRLVDPRTGEGELDRDNVGPRPFVVRLDEDGAVVVPEDDASVEIRVATADGAPVDGETIRLTRVSDGWSFTVTTGEDEEDEDEPSGTALATVPHGTYDAEPASPCEPAAFAPFRVDVAKGGRAEWDVVAVQRPMLEIHGTIPAGANVALALPGYDTAAPDDLAAWRLPLPAEGPAVLSVQPIAGQRAVFFFAVGPAKDGVRAVDVDVPPPHRVRIADTEKLGVERFTCDGFDVAWESDGPVLSTYAEGPMVLDATIGGGVRRFAFDLPPKENAELVLDAAAAPVVAPPGIVHVVTEGKGARVRVESSNSSISGGTSAEAPPPCRVVVTRPGHQPFDRTFTQAAEVRHVWGPCSLHLTVRDDSGAAAPSIVQVDGVTHWTKDGALDLAGLASGPHDVAVSPVRGDVVGRELRIVLREDESRTRDVVLPKR